LQFIIIIIIIIIRNLYTCEISNTVKSWPKPQTKGKDSGDAERDIKEAVAKVKNRLTRDDAINA